MQNKRSNGMFIHKRGIHTTTLLEFSVDNLLSKRATKEKENGGRKRNYSGLIMREVNVNVLLRVFACAPPLPLCSSVFREQGLERNEREGS